MKLHPVINTYLEGLKPETISEERKKLLNPLSEFIKQKQENGQVINLNFICTHNSRRSLLSQIWAQAIAVHTNTPDVFTFSGGTEATAVYPTVLQTLGKVGFQIETLSQQENPIYTVKYSKNYSPIIAFSKKYDHFFNPETEFAAILTCSQADKGCPFIPGAEKRIPITFEDPKAYDHTDHKK